MPQKIIIVRHGETDYNKERRMQGWIDVPLNETGHAQAKATAEKLLSFTFDAIYSSDLIRAHATAKYIASLHQKEISTTQALRERDMGIFSGWAWEKERDEEKDKLWIEFQASQTDNYVDWNKHQGESMTQMSKRVSEFLSTLHVVHRDQSVLLVTHGGTINRILEHYSVKAAAEGFRMIGNASVLVLHKTTDQYRLEEI